MLGGSFWWFLVKLDCPWWVLVVLMVLVGSWWFYLVLGGFFCVLRFLGGCK